MSGRADFAARGAAAAVMAVIGVAAAASCTQDFGQFFQGTTAPAGTPTGTGGSGGGTTGECTVPEDCPGTDTTCEQRTCVDQVCDTTFAAEGTPCTEAGGAVCDGAGSCVECTTAEDCPGDELCEEQSCVPPACANGTLDGEETDLDCGGPDCNPCENGDDCLLARDCESRFCSDGGAGGAGGAGSASVCDACSDDGDCTAATGTWCNTNVEGGSCVDKTPDGGACSGANQCESGFCPPGDNVCCDTLCQQTCRACVQSKTGTADGTCDYVTAGTDPDSECDAAAVTTCGAAGQGCSGTEASCVLYDDTTVCQTETCVGSTLYSERLCDGDGICTTGTSDACPGGYVCNGAGTACLDSCAANGDCVSNHWCDTSDNTCQPDKADGEPCTNFLQCQSGSCPFPDNVCCDATCNRECESCLDADHGGGDGNCLPIAAGEPDPDPAQSCNSTQYQAPCGGDVCNGSASTPACVAACDSCATLYDSHPQVYDICDDTYDTCRLGVNTSGGDDCATICASGGGECVGYYNNSGACGLGSTETCTTTGFTTSICICSHGCGTDPPCDPATQTCSSGTCS